MPKTAKNVSNNARPDWDRILPRDLPSWKRPGRNIQEISALQNLLFFPHELWRESCQKIDNLRRDGKRSPEVRARDGFGIVVIGKPGSGKSELLDSYKLQMAPDSKRILTVPIRAKATSSLLTQTILTKLEIRYPSAGNAEHRRQRCLEALDAQQIELLMFDEIHHFLNKSSRADVNTTGAMWLKEFLDDAGIPFVLCGPPSAKKIFTEEEELTGRVQTFISYNPFLWKNKERREAFVDMLRLMEETLPFFPQFKFSSEETAARVYRETGGSIRIVKKLIRNCAEIVLLKNLPAITTVVFEEAVRSTKVSGNDDE